MTTLDRSSLRTLIRAGLPAMLLSVGSAAFAYGCATSPRGEVDLPDAAGDESRSLEPSKPDSDDGADSKADSGTQAPKKDAGATKKLDASTPDPGSNGNNALGENPDGGLPYCPGVVGGCWTGDACCRCEEGLLTCIALWPGKTCEDYDGCTLGP